MISMNIHETTPLLTPEGSAIRSLRLDLQAPRYGITLPEIHGTLTSYSVCAAPAYEALSYTWGDISKSFPIMLNGTEFLIPHALHEGLLQLLQQGENHDSIASRYLWVDLM